jgi:hypothetical protein
MLPLLCAVVGAHFCLPQRTTLVMQVRYVNVTALAKVDFDIVPYPYI